MSKHVPPSELVADGRRSRVRTSEKAIRAALKALQDAGLSVDKVCVSGAQIEIHCGHVERVEPQEEDGGLEEW
ncbi:hypothetical protein [Aquamicrobium soli]|uniref:Uncharacterized protein n=1 Tax=Aquamicrobium soli TaxID=1811518 RepID=A0ABV7KE68_9HYPH